MKLIAPFFTCLFAEAATNILCYGHRGYAKNYPENTLLSFERAIEAGVDGIELDIRQTKDKVLIVMHDISLDRTTNGSGNVSDHEYEYIKSLFTKDRFQKVPTLKQVLELAERENVKVIVDIKDDNEIGILNTLKSVLDDSDLDNITLGVWNEEFVNQLRILFPGKQKSFISEKYNPQIIFSNFSLDYHNIDQSIITDIHSANKTVYAWTVNDAKTIFRLANWKIDGIITDDPSLCQVMRPFVGARK